MDPHQRHILRMGYLYLEWFVLGEDYKFSIDFEKKYCTENKLAIANNPPND